MTQKDQTKAASPDPEVVPKASRRRFSAAYKLRILEAADQCQDSGEIGALLRREGLYSSHLTKWRQARRKGALQALKPTWGRPAHPEYKKATDRHVKALELKIAKMEAELGKAHTIIDIQKKLCTLLGLPTAENDKNTL